VLAFFFFLFLGCDSVFVLRKYIAFVIVGFGSRVLRGIVLGERGLGIANSGDGGEFGK
jgi:hypothetical protein